MENNKDVNVEPKKCFCCNTPLSKSNKTGVCLVCKRDDNKTITATNAKKKYGLTDIDLGNESLNCFVVSSYGAGVGYKFFVEEIEKYIENMVNLGDKKIIKKKQKNDEEKMKKQKTTEISKFMLNNIKNQHHPDIISLKHEYIISKVLVLEDISQKMKDIDDKITVEEQKKLLFFDNLTSIVVDKLNDDKYWNQLGFSDEFKSLKNEIMFVKYIKNLKKHITDTYDKFNNNIVSKGEILKTEIADKLAIEHSNVLISRYRQSVREHELIQKLKKYNLELRSDSKLCKYYIEGGIKMVNENMDNPISSVDDIVEIMNEMNFYHNKTDYPGINRSQLLKYSYYVYESDSDDYNGYNTGYYDHVKPISEINLIAKKLALKRINKMLLQNAPKNVIMLYESMNENMNENMNESINGKK